MMRWCQPVVTAVRVDTGKLVTTRHNSRRVAGERIVWLLRSNDYTDVRHNGDTVEEDLNERDGWAYTDVD